MTATCREQLANIVLEVSDRSGIVGYLVTSHTHTNAVLLYIFHLYFSRLGEAVHTRFAVQMPCFSLSQPVCAATANEAPRRLAMTATKMSQMLCVLI